MITITQFTLTQLKAAKALVAQAKTSAGPAAATQIESSSSADVAPNETSPTEAGGAEAAPIDPAADLAAKLSAELKIDDKKASYLIEALRVIGNRFDKVRQVRVVQTTGAPLNAVQVGEVAYILDMLQRPANQSKSGDRGGSGRRDGPNKRGSQGKSGQRRDGPGKQSDGRSPGPKNPAAHQGRPTAAMPTTKGK